MLFSVGIDLWTDALWFRSVGFDSVFWTRIGAQFALFLVGLILALVVLLGNLWLAGRFSPAPTDRPRGNLRGVFDRLNERATGRRPAARPVHGEPDLRASAIRATRSSRPTTCPT